MLGARRRAFCLVGSACAGYVLAAHFPHDALGFRPGSALLFSLALIALIPPALPPRTPARSRAAERWCLAAVLLLAGAWFTARIHEAPRRSLLRSTHIAHAHANADGARTPTNPIIEVEGVVVAPPVVDPPRRGSLAQFQPFQRRRESQATYTLAAFTLHTPAGPQPVSGDLRVIAPARDNAAPRIGSTLRIVGAWLPPAPPTNPGQPDWRQVNAQHHRVGLLVVASGGRAPVDTGAMPPAALAARATIARIVHALRAGATRTLDTLLHPASDPSSRRADAPPDAPRPLLTALLLGQRDPTSDALGEAFARVGLAHVLAISGFHLVLLAGIAALTLRLVRDWGWAEPVAIAALVLLYMLLVPARAPIVRAGLLTLALLAADASGRRYDRLTILAWVTLGLLVWRPMDLFSIGLQLSVLVTGALIGLAPGVARRIAPPSAPLGQAGQASRIPSGARVVRLLRWLGAALAVQTLAWTAASPMIAHHSGLVSPLAPVVMLVLLPVVIASLAVGQASLIVASLIPSSAGIMGDVLSFIASLLARAVLAADQLPLSSLRVGPISVLWAIAATIGVIVAFRLFINPSRVRRPLLTCSTIAAMLCVWFAAEATLRWRTPPGVAARIDMLDVGDGSCLLVRSGRDALLWDVGGSSPALGVRELPAAVRALGVRAVPTVIITHADIDHFIALPDVIKPLGVRRVLLTPQFLAQARSERPGAARYLLELLESRGVHIELISAGSRVALGNAALHVAWPPADATFKDDNAASLVARLTVPTRAGERSALLTGDMQARAIRGLLDTTPSTLLQPCNILEAPHHGSAIEVAMLATLRLSPDIVLQSTGPSRLDDPRWAPVRQRRTWLATARHGGIFAEIRSDGTLRAGRSTP